MNIQNRIYVTLSPRIRKALELCATLDGSTVASYAANLLSPVLFHEIEKSPALHDRWIEMEREALEKGTWEGNDIASLDKLDEEFTVRADKALTLAQEEAIRFRHDYLSTEHILLGLIGDHEATAAQVLLNLGMDLNEVYKKVESQLKCGDHSFIAEIGLTPQAQKVIKLAADEARCRARHAIGTEHLLLGLMREGKGLAALVLNDLGITLHAIRACIFDMLRQEGTDRDTPSNTKEE